MDSFADSFQIPKGFPGDGPRVFGSLRGPWGPRARCLPRTLGFVGNPILLAQRRPEEITQTLPPSEADVSKCMSVCFNSDKVSRTQVKSQKALTVDPAEFLELSKSELKIKN